MTLFSFENYIGNATREFMKNHKLFRVSSFTTERVWMPIRDKPMKRIPIWYDRMVGTPCIICGNFSVCILCIYAATRTHFTVPIFTRLRFPAKFPIHGRRDSSNWVGSGRSSWPWMPRIDQTSPARRHVGRQSSVATKRTMRKWGF
jgi:hypothetical protein